MNLKCTAFAASVASLLLLAPSLEAQIPPGYYQTVDATSSTNLRMTLHDVIDDHVRYPYTASSTDTWNILESAEQDPNDAGNIIDVYRNASLVKIGGGVGAYNREHVWPKSYGFPNDGLDNYPYTDCHHLHLSDAQYNSDRSNKPFDTCTPNCAEEPTVFTNGQGGGSGVYPGNSNWTSGSFTNGRWEVWRGRRGDIARTMFYMDIRYEGGTHGGTGASEPDLRLTDDRNLMDQSNTGQNRSIGYMGLLSVLLQWHEQDPVDAFERRRNDVVYSYQGNRNPFVDHPEWVRAIYQPCPADWSTYGSGLAGTNGVPGASLTAMPRLGSSPGYFVSNSLGTSTVGAFVLGLSSNLIPLFGGFMYENPDVVAPLALGPAGSTVPLSIPGDANLLCARIWLQSVLVDPGAVQGFAITPALRVDLGY
ncbi:MAG: endonuclease [Planctomycetes bacterium]|nr:endonuclease [Planctomycetota bacterium]